MCGFAGFIGFSNFSKDKVESIASNMGDAIFHRGPDDFGIWRDDSAEVVLTHRRLSILYLSMAGHQLPIKDHHHRYLSILKCRLYCTLRLVQSN